MIEGNKMFKVVNGKKIWYHNVKFLVHFPKSGDSVSWGTDQTISQPICSNEVIEEFLNKNNKSDKTIILASLPINKIQISMPSVTKSESTPIMSQNSTSFDYEGKDLIVEFNLNEDEYVFFKQNISSASGIPINFVFTFSARPVLGTINLKIDYIDIMNKLETTFGANTPIAAISQGEFDLTVRQIVQKKTSTLVVESGGAINDKLIEQFAEKLTEDFFAPLVVGGPSTVSDPENAAGGAQFTLKVRAQHFRSNQNKSEVFQVRGEVQTTPVEDVRSIRCDYIDTEFAHKSIAESEPNQIRKNTILPRLEKGKTLSISPMLMMEMEFAVAYSDKYFSRKELAELLKQNASNPVFAINKDHFDFGEIIVNGQPRATRPTAVNLLKLGSSRLLDHVVYGKSVPSLKMINRRESSLQLESERWQKVDPKSVFLLIDNVDLVLSVQKIIQEKSLDYSQKYGFKISYNTETGTITVEAKRDLVNIGLLYYDNAKASANNQDVKIDLPAETFFQEKWSGIFTRNRKKVNRDYIDYKLTEVKSHYKKRRYFIVRVNAPFTPVTDLIELKKSKK